ncbi:MAG: hypothetical protein J3K34DRAFT_473612 [Monoraphidium minutum]|nr:MAG: hypothetical protein J3K34DRAFT_473612 [Monoraphidium minutum]
MRLQRGRRAALVLSVSSAGAVFQKLPDVPPITLAAWRLQLTSLILAAGFAAQWRRLPAAARARALALPDAGWTLFSGACLAVHFGAWVASLKATSLPHSLLMVSMGPVLLVLLALARRKPISRGEVAGTLLALAGAGVLAAGAATGRDGSQVTLLGDGLAFAAAVAVVGYLEAGARLRTYQPAFVYAAPVTGLAAALLTAAALATEARGALVGGDRRGAFGWAASWQYAPYIIWLGTVSGIVGHTGFNTLLRYLSSLSISLAIQLEPLFGPLIGWALGVMAPPSRFTWAGGAVLLAATSLVLVASARREAAAAAGAARRQRSLAPPGDEGDEEGAPSTSGRPWPGDGAWALSTLRGMATQRGPAAVAAAAPQLKLNSLADAPGAVSERKRWGRGNGGGRGTYCGHKPGILFDGGQKELKKLPKVGARPSNPVVYAKVNLETIMEWVRAGRLDASRAITMQDLRNSGAVAKRILWGVKLLGWGADQVDIPLHLQVSACSAPARAAVEAAGGSVTAVYYNTLGLRALLKPEAFEAKGRRLPSAPRAWPPRDNGKFDAIGQLPPARTPPAAPRALPAPPAGGGAPAAAAAAPA